MAGCKRSSSDPKPLPSGSAGPIASGVPIAPEVISKVVNPRQEQPYDGPVATVRGTVRMTGDAPPDQPEILRQIPDGCDRAREFYEKLFREGPGRTVADVFVAVTGYRGYVPQREPVATVEALGCAWSTRTVGLTFGQRLEIAAKDRRAYVPDLLGGRVGVQLIALPGSGSALYPEAPGRYVLVDSMRIYATAEVLVVKYATFDVTDVDGKFSISGIPAGPVTVNALLPATGATVQREVVLEPGKDLELNLELHFDAAAHRQRLEANKKASPAASTSASKPSAPAPSSPAP